MELTITNVGYFPNAQVGLLKILKLKIALQKNIMLNLYTDISGQYFCLFPQSAEMIVTAPLRAILVGMGFVNVGAIHHVQVILTPALAGYANVG